MTTMIKKKCDSKSFFRNERQISISLISFFLFDMVYVKFGLFNELLGQLQIGPYKKIFYSLYFIRKIA